jgi:hypothetical protein
MLPRRGTLSPPGTPSPACRDRRARDGEGIAVFLDRTNQTVVRLHLGNSDGG